MKSKSSVKRKNRDYGKKNRILVQMGVSGLYEKHLKILGYSDMNPTTDIAKNMIKGIANI